MGNCLLGNIYSIVLRQVAKSLLLTWCLVGHSKLFLSPSYSELVVKIRSIFSPFADVISARETT